MTPTDDQPEPGRRAVSPRILVIIGVAIVVVVAGIALLTRGNDDSAQTASGGSSPSPSPGASASSPSPGSPTSKASSSSKASGSASGSPSPVLSAGKPLRAAFTQAARPAPSLVVDITRVEKIQAKAEIPGEVSGPALRITVRVRNTSNKTVPIKSALANLYYGPERTPATLMTHPGAKAFPEKIPAGGTGTGVVLFTVPPKQRGNVVLEVIIDAEMRRIEFRGDCTGQC